MTGAEFQNIAEHIAELEEAFMEWDVRGDGATARLPWLHQTIVALMDASAETLDDDTRDKLAGLEYRAPRCREAILRCGGGVCVALSLLKRKWLWTGG